MPGTGSAAIPTRAAGARAGPASSALQRLGKEREPGAAGAAGSRCQRLAGHSKDEHKGETSQR